MALQDASIISPAYTACSSIIPTLRSYLTWPRAFRPECEKLGIKWPSGILLAGPPGVGKTSMVQEVAREVGAQVYSITPADLVGSKLGETERRLRDTFRTAHKSSHLRTTVIFIDEIDALFPQRSRALVHESRAVAQLLTLIDGVSSSNRDLQVIAATNQVGAVDTALRRPGRFDWEIVVPVPDDTERLAIFRQYTKDLKLYKDVDICELSRVCHGYTHADIKALCRESLLSSMDNALHMVASESLFTAEWAVHARHFEQAMNTIGPSIVRGLQHDPSAGLSHIGGYE
eukprot:jgi/Ulvmu1/6357/UM029_0065.1